MSLEIFNQSPKTPQACCHLPAACKTQLLKESIFLGFGARLLDLMLTVPLAKHPDFMESVAFQGVTRVWLVVFT